MPRLEKIKIEKIKPYKNNARIHSEMQIKQIQNSIREFGFINPVLIDNEYNIIAGHGRVAAAIQEGMSEVPCVFIEHLTDAQKQAYVIADNQLALNASWDDELLKSEVDKLSELDFDIALLGFEDEPEITLDDFFDSDAESEKDERLTCCPKCGFEWVAK